MLIYLNLYILSFEYRLLSVVNLLNVVAGNQSSKFWTLVADLCFGGLQTCI